ncbi:hypothetical protein [Paraburkholderia sp.]|uniref:hypothetical protein n=1 Tax=Paraburkholderia sp. TaxID=1926495 RepID=UPI003C7DAB61
MKKRPDPLAVTETELDWLVLEGKSAARRTTDERQPDWHKNFVRGIIEALKQMKEQGIG